ncbi:MAG: 1-aminocyclopropane-1-carboxylate deaminase/D-cysteine desulfhydrase [Ilumatobacter sp.]|uniref:1-aminocyclopropane-1-carboxylate deaminase/D-cysteine desulfhydrase n=1 Tax=Ilumatobacter sp. TaxID=1967498 RepID=UPI00391DB53C
MQAATALDALPRVDLGSWPTVLERASRLGTVLDCDELWLKRDDLSGFSWGGNKVRTVEYLLGDALARGATEIVLAGGPSSNFAALMAAGARSVGLGVHQISYGREPDHDVAALVEGRRLGTNVVFTGSPDRSAMEDVAERHAADRSRAGQVPYLVPRGGASDVGALGFFAAARELEAQVVAEQSAAGTSGVGRVPSAVVIPLGSGGSVAGLVAGLCLSTREWLVHAVSVSRDPESITEPIVNTSIRCAALVGVTLRPDEIFARLQIHDGRAPGFGEVSAAQQALMGEVTGATGLLVDPTYNAKAMAWMRDANRRDTLGGQPAIYWHTGGALGAFDHSRVLERNPTP